MPKAQIFINPKSKEIDFTDTVWQQGPQLETEKAPTTERWQRNFLFGIASYLLSKVPDEKRNAILEGFKYAGSVERENRG